MALYNPQLNQNSVVFEPNLNFEVLKSRFSISTLVNLFASLILEYKVVLIADSSNEMALVFACLLSLVQPIDPHIFTVVPFLYQTELTQLLQKPGALLTSMSLRLWESHGREVYQ